MKRILTLCAALIAGSLHADMYVHNTTPYKVKLSFTYDASIGDKGKVLESQVFQPHEEGWVSSKGDGLLTKTSYKINADIDTNYSDSKDWPVVYNQTGASDGWNRKITIFSYTDANGNEVFTITNAVML